MYPIGNHKHSHIMLDMNMDEETFSFDVFMGSMGLVLMGSKNFSSFIEGLEIFKDVIFACFFSLSNLKKLLIF